MNQANSPASENDGEKTGDFGDDLTNQMSEAIGDDDVDKLVEQSLAPPPKPDASTNDAGGGGGGDDADRSADKGGRPTPAKAIHHEMRRGRIAAVRGEDVFVELTGETNKLQGVVPLSQFDRAPRMGSIMDFVVDHVDEQQGLMYLSREGAISRSTWEQLQRGAVVEARCVASNKGGLELEMIGGIRAFMPASQIDIHHVKDLESMVGQRLEAMVQEIDRKSKKVLLSRRQYLEQQKAIAREKVLGDLEVGQVREGTVSNVVDFGAFVDIGGIDGLVHVSDLSYSRVDKPSDHLKTGDKVQVKVLKIDADKDRISLGIKQVQPDPWEAADSQLAPGEQVTGTITRVADFGAFVEVMPGVEGLLPISELSWSRVNKVGDAVQKGQSVRLKVLSVDLEKKRLSLSLKQAAGDPWVGAEGKFVVGSVHEGTVLSTTDFGAFVQLEDGIEGLVHISELSDRRVGKVEDVLKVGDSTKVRVLEIDEAERRVKLSVKQVDKPQTDPDQAAMEAQAAAAARQGKGGDRAKRKPRKDLKSGLGTNHSMGMGLGNLRLEDL